MLKTRLGAWSWSWHFNDDDFFNQYFMVYGYTDSLGQSIILVITGKDEAREREEWIP